MNGVPMISGAAERIEQGAIGADAPGGGAGSNLLGGILMAGGMVMLVMLMLRKTWRHTRIAKARDSASARERIEAVRADAEEQAIAHGATQGIVAGAADTVRQLAAALETRAARLEALLDMADERIATLEALERRTPHDEHTPRVVGRGPIDQDLRRAAGMPDQAESVEGLSRSVRRLADEGLTAAEIAAELGEPIGAVQLMLNLQRRA